MKAAGYGALSCLGTNDVGSAGGFYDVVLNAGNGGRGGRG
jgi:hypothetical protein